MDEMHIGHKLKDKHINLICDTLIPALPLGENIEGIFWASKTRPLTEAIVITNRRLMSVYYREIPVGRGFFNEIQGDDLVADSIEFSGWSTTLKFRTADNEEHSYCSVRKEDADDIKRLLTAMSGSSAPVTVGRQNYDEQQREAVQRVQTASESAPVQRTKTGVCPRCGSDRIQAVQEITRGLNYGFYGKARNFYRIRRVCVDCGKKFT